MREHEQAAPSPSTAGAARAGHRKAGRGMRLPAIVAAPVRPGWASLPAGGDLLSVPADDLLAYPGQLAASLTKVAEVAVPLEGAPDARLIAFRALDQGIEHMAILVGDPASEAAPLVRRNLLTAHRLGGGIEVAMALFSAASCTPAAPRRSSRPR